MTGNWAASRGDVAVFCSYVPLELIEAHGFRPRLVSGRESSSPDPSLPANLCPYVRSAASFLAGEEGSGLAGAVLTDSCAPMLRLWDFTQLRTRIPLRFLLRVPRLRSARAVDFFLGELERLSRCLAGAGGERPSGSCLHQVLESYNRSRELGARLGERMLGGRVPQLARSLADLHARAHLLPRDEFNGRLERLLAMPERAGGEGIPGPRILVAGSFFIHSELIRQVEELGGVVVALDSCAHDRLGTVHIPTKEGDPLLALAGGYLDKPPCPRMRSSREHVTRMGRLAREGHLAGMIYVLMRNCTPHAYSVPLWKEAMDAAGVRTLVLEAESSDWVAPQAATRIEAFMETLR